MDMRNRMSFGRIGIGKYNSFYFFLENTIITLVARQLKSAVKQISP